MIVAQYSRRPQNAYSGFAVGFVRNYVNPSVVTLLTRYEGVSITLIVECEAGDSIKGVAKMINGSGAVSLPHTVRFRIKELFN